MALAVGLWATLAARGQTGDRTQEDLPTPGSVALEVRQLEDPKVREHWRRALREGGPETRGAAARVVHARRAVELIDDLRDALRDESDPRAALEEADALAALSDEKDDRVLLEAGRRLGDAVMAAIALSLARSRGSAVIPRTFTDVRAALAARGLLPSFLRAAARKDESALATVAKNALESSDSEAWLAVLDASIEVEIPLDRGLLTSALTHESEKVAAETAWRLAASFARELPSDAAELLAILSKKRGTAKRAGEVDLMIGIEMLGRALGREPMESRAWLAWLKTSDTSRIDSHLTENAVTGLLTSGERRALKKRFKRLFPERKPADPQAPSPYGLSWKMRPAKDLPVVRLAGGFPPGFVSGAIAASGCSLAQGPLLAEAAVSFDPMGLPSRVELKRTPPTPECIEAVSALFASSLAAGDGHLDPERPELLFLVLEEGHLSRLEDPGVLAGPGSYLSPPGGGTLEITPPQRMHHVQPEYPEAVRLARRTGWVVVEIVINRSGLVTDIRLLERTDEGFVSSAFAAVAQWRYRPALANGKPVRVYVTVVVDYRLR